MADPQDALATQLRNIETKTGRRFADLCRLIAASGLSKVGEQRTMLMETLGLGYGDANALALRAREATAPAAANADPLDAIYGGAKAPLRSLHERLSASIDALGAHEKAPKKSYLSLRRKKQFATLGPATRDAIELGLNAKGLRPSPRLRILPAGGMCQYAVRISHAEEIDDELIGWARSAYDAAG